MVLLATAIIALLETPGTYPIPPRTLRAVYREADLVVVAKAGKPELLEPDAEYHWRWTKVALTITRTLKGKADGAEVAVLHNPGIVCPAPDRYPEGETLLVFLKWKPDLKAFRSVALSYGVMKPEAATIARIEELAKIPAEKNFYEPVDATIEWLVRCIEEPATRWHGAYEFCEQELWGLRLRGEEHPEPIPLTRLDKSQMKRIIDAFVQAKNFDYGQFTLLRLLHSQPEPRIDRYLQNELQCEDAPYADDLMEALIDRLDFQAGLPLLEQFKELDYKDKPGRRKLIKTFLDLLKSL